MSKTGKVLFQPGQIVATPGAIEAIHASGDSSFDLLMRHLTGDWSEMSEHDRAENQVAVDKYLRILSSYKLKDGRVIWLITVADRSSTCFLLPEEY